MDAKKGQVSTQTKKGNGRKFIKFFSEVKQELKRIDWTSKEELKTYTKIVLGSTFVFGLFVYFADLLIQGVLGGINILVKFLAG